MTQITERTAPAPLLSLTVRREAATVVPLADAAAWLAETRKAFPDCALEIEPTDGGAVVKTAASMRVARWLRV